MCLPCRNIATKVPVSFLPIIASLSNFSMFSSTKRIFFPCSIATCAEKLQENSDTAQCFWYHRIQRGSVTSGPNSSTAANSSTSINDLCSGTSGQSLRKRRSRTNHDATQRDTLEAFFNHTPYPNKETLAQLAVAVKLNPYVRRHIVELRHSLRGRWHRRCDL